MVDWVRAAIRDELGLTDAGGTVEITPERLEIVAAVAVQQTVGFMVAAGKEGLIETRGGDDE